MLKKEPGAAIGWQVIAVIIALIVCGRSIVERQWLGAVLGIIAVCGWKYTRSDGSLCTAHLNERNRDVSPLESV